VRAEVPMVAALLLLLLGAPSAWILTPPYPTPGELIDSSLSALTARLGPPAGEIPRIHPGRSFAWQKSRLFAVWTLRADWNSPSPGAMTPADDVSRCLRIEWVAAWANVMLPCKAVSRARVMHRFSALYDRPQVVAPGNEDACSSLRLVKHDPVVP
jgi:hypothetical protein